MRVGPHLETDSGSRVPIPTAPDGTGTCSIGRDEGNDVVIDLAAVSRHHAVVSRKGTVCRVEDLHSRNGTYLNGEDVRGPAVLSDGDVVVIGGASRLVFRDPRATPMAPRIGRLTGVWIDASTDAVWIDAVRLEPPLSTLQLRLLKLLEANVGEVVSRVTIVDVVWAEATAVGVSDDAVNALLKRLRARLREGPFEGEYVEIIKGRGVRLRRDVQGLGNSTD